MARFSLKISRCWTRSIRERITHFRWRSIWRSQAIIRNMIKRWLRRPGDQKLQRARLPGSKTCQLSSSKDQQIRKITGSSSPVKEMCTVGSPRKPSHQSNSVKLLIQEVEHHPGEAQLKTPREARAASSKRRLRKSTRWVCMVIWIKLSDHRVRRRILRTCAMGNLVFWWTRFRKLYRAPICAKVLKTGSSDRRTTIHRGHSRQEVGT